MIWVFVPFRKKGTNYIVLRTEAFVSAGSGEKLLRVIRNLSKGHVNPVNPVRYFFHKSNMLQKNYVIFYPKNFRIN
jgi:hypothetical protein